jgi:hypothetical protein
MPAGENVVALNEPHRPKFARVSAAALVEHMIDGKKKRLPGEALRVLIAIALHADKNLRSRPGRRLLTTESGVNSRHLSRNLRILQEADLVRCLPDGSYRIVIERPEVGPEQREVAPERPEVAPERPEVGPERPGVGPERPEVGPERPEVGPERPEVGPERPEVGPERPEVGTRATRNRENRETEQTRTYRREREAQIVVDEEGDPVDQPEPIDAFERFWSAYSHRPDDPKTRARREWSELMRQGIDPEITIAAAERQATTIQEPRYARHAWRWLHDREFEDQESANPFAWSRIAGVFSRLRFGSDRYGSVVEAAQAALDAGPLKPVNYYTSSADLPEGWSERIRQLGEDGIWRQHWGPSPNEADCELPRNFWPRSAVKRWRENPQIEP